MTNFYSVTPNTTDKNFQLATAVGTFMLLEDRNSKLLAHILQHFFPAGRVMNLFLPGAESAQNQKQHNSHLLKQMQ